MEKSFAIVKEFSLFLKTLQPPFRNKIKIFPLLSQPHNKYIFEAEKRKSTERRKRKKFTS
jgi:hypothetical protein